MPAINPPIGSLYSSQDQCLFFQKIPAELRNEIYSLIVPVDSNVIMAFFAHPTVFGDDNLKIDDDSIICEDPIMEPEFFGLQDRLALDRTCRRMHDEVSALYYGTNRFSFYDGFRLYKFLHSIGPINRATVTRLEFRWGGRCPKQQMLLLADCVNLKQLHIGIYRPEMEGVMTKKTTIWNTHGLSTLRAIRGLPDLDLKVRQIRGYTWDWDTVLCDAFMEIQPEHTKLKLEFLPPYIRAWQIFPDAVIEQLEAVLKKELGDDKDPNAQNMRKPEVVTRVRETSILGAQLQLRPTTQDSKKSVVLSKCRITRAWGEEQRRRTAKKGKN